jgi:HD-like signal output (HDOD) protein
MLPAAPCVWKQLTAMLEDDNVTVQDVGLVLETDPALGSKLLQLTNSPFFGLRRRISSVGEAVSYLGLALIRKLVTSLGAEEAIPVHAQQFDPHAFQQQSLRTARIARHLAATPGQADDFFAAGLLHDVGKLVLSSTLPARYDRLASAAAASGRSFEEEEATDLECASHLRLGVYLLKLWGLPAPIVDAIASHRDPASVEAGELGVAGAVYLGRQLLDEASGGATPIDHAFVARVGGGSRLAGWRSHATDVVAA